MCTVEILILHMEHNDKCEQSQLSLNVDIPKSESLCITNGFFFNCQLLIPRNGCNSSFMKRQKLAITLNFSGGVTFIPHNCLAKSLHILH
jgi:hypothetical protein